MKRNRIFAFDFIRIIAMFSIIVYHYNVLSAFYSVKANPILFVEYANGTMGHIGVSLFFILSGASLMHSYREKLEMKEYFKKRFFSIYPLYWLTFAAFFIHFYYFGHRPMIYPKYTLILSFLGLDGYLFYKIPNYYLVGEWFVGCILIFYLLFPLLRRIVRNHPVLTAVFTVILYIPYEAFYPFQMEKEWFFLSRLPEFLFGMYLAAYGRRLPDWKIGTAAALSFLVTFFVPVPLPELYPVMWMGMSLFVALTWLSRFFEFSWFKKFIEAASSYSFAIFLVHHVLIPRFLDPVKEMPLNYWQNHLLFLRYFIFVSVIGVIFYYLSKACVRFLGIFCRSQIGH